MKHVKTYKFTRGQKLPLDAIYRFSGIGDDVVGRWWDYEKGNYLGGKVVVTKNITIRIEIRTPDALNGKEQNHG